MPVNGLVTRMKRVPWLEELGIIHNAHAIRPTLHRKSIETNAATPARKLFRYTILLGGYHFLARPVRRVSFYVSR